RNSLSGQERLIGSAARYALVPKLPFGNACLRNSVSRPYPVEDRNGVSEERVPKREFGNAGKRRYLAALQISPLPPPARASGGSGRAAGAPPAAARRASPQTPP